MIFHQCIQYNHSISVIMRLHFHFYQITDLIIVQPSRIKCSHQNVDISRFLVKNIYVKCALLTETMPLIFSMTTSNRPQYFILGSTVINFSVVLGFRAYMLVYTKYGALLVLIIFKCWTAKFRFLHNRLCSSCW